MGALNAQVKLPGVSLQLSQVNKPEEVVAVIKILLILIMD